MSNDSNIIIPFVGQGRAFITIKDNQLMLEIDQNDHFIILGDNATRHLAEQLNKAIEKTK